MPPVFIQGLRRSGTTFLYDTFLEDKRFKCFYEPFAAGIRALGGGSGMHGHDLFNTVTEKRKSFLDAYPQWRERCPDFNDLNLLNYGAPRLPALEFEPDFPAYCYDYLKHLLDGSEIAVLKFTRMYNKIPALAQVAPDAKFIHILRDPRFVAMSYLFGRSQVNRRKFANLFGQVVKRKFFNKCSNYTAWSSYPFSEFIFSLADFSSISEREDIGRMLVLWRYVFEKTHAYGQAVFGERYRLLRQEDFVSEPRKVLEDLYEFIGMDASPEVLDWAEENARPPKPLFAEGDRAWLDAFDTYGLHDAIRAANYSNILE